jgi:hypothetical protein
MKAWTTPADLRAQLQKLWEQGRLLSFLVDGTSPFPLKLALRTPDSRECSDRFGDVRDWARALLDAERHGLRVVLREWRHPVLGRNELPREAWLDRPEDAWRWLGQRAAAARYESLVTTTRAAQPLLLPWLARRPLQVLELADDWPGLLAVVAWLQARPRPGIYLRELDLPGVDTKFVERHRPVLVELLDLALPSEAIDGASAGAAGFARRFGFREPPARVRLRTLDATVSLLGTGGPEDVTVDADTFARLKPAVERVFVTENETNFLAFPSVPRSLVVFGAGYGLKALTAAPWLRECEVLYWGDIDTHGFAILDELRAGLPHARSLLMDSATLLEHRAQWVEEPAPTARDLSRLTPAERALYDDLRWRRIEPRPLRLEQERVAYGRVRQVLKDCGIGPGRLT